MSIAGREKAMQTSYIFCPGFVTDYWHWYTASSGHFYSNFYVRPQIFPEAIPQIDPQSKCCCSTQHLTVQAHCWNGRTWCSEVHTAFCLLMVYVDTNILEDVVDSFRLCSCCTWMSLAETSSVWSREKTQHSLRCAFVMGLTLADAHKHT